MEKEDKDILQKIRSSRACIRDGYRMFTERFRRIFRHTWKWAIGFAVLSAVASALPVLVSPTLTLAGLLIEVVAVVVFLWLANRQLHKRGFFEETQKVDFKAWMRHLGMLLLIMIVCLVIVSILILFTSLPSVIMMAANWESQMGVINGDPQGMPDYVMWLSIGAFLIAGFLRAYVWLTVLCPLYLAKVSIALQEKEREEFNQKSITKNNEEKAIVYRS